MIVSYNGRNGHRYIRPIGCCDPHSLVVSNALDAPRLLVDKFFKRDTYTEHLAPRRSVTAGAPNRIVYVRIVPFLEQSVRQSGHRQVSEMVNAVHIFVFVMGQQHCGKILRSVVCCEPGQSTDLCALRTAALLPNLHRDLRHLQRSCPARLLSLAVHKHALSYRELRQDHISSLAVIDVSEHSPVDLIPADTVEHLPRYVLSDVLHIVAALMEDLPCVETEVGGRKEQPSQRLLFNRFNFVKIELRRVAQVGHRAPPYPPFARLVIIVFARQSPAPRESSRQHYSCFLRSSRLLRQLPVVRCYRRSCQRWLRSSWAVQPSRSLARRGLKRPCGRSLVMMTSS